MLNSSAPRIPEIHDVLSDKNVRNYIVMDYIHGNKGEELVNQQASHYSVPRNSLTSYPYRAGWE